MPDKITIYEKPTWSTCREVRRLLAGKGMETELVNYLERPLTESQLKDLLRAAGLKPAEAIRTKEPAYAKFVAGKNLTDPQLVRVMVEHPELIQRPFVVRGKKAVLARPVDRLSDLGI